MYVPPKPKNDLEYSLQRLDAILSRRRLTFNPYTVSDARLLEIASTTGWGNSNVDITEIVTVHFTRLREVSNWRKFNGIFMRVGSSPEEIPIPLGTLIHGVTANDTRRLERTWVGKKPITNEKHVEALVGKSYFVSRIVRGVNWFGNYKGAYRMHRLFGKPEKDARIIREAMCAAKIEMLERILLYPQSPDYLSCSTELFDYETRIQRAISIIRRFPETPIPQDS